MRAWFRSTVGGLSGTYWVIWSGILVNRAGGFAILFLTLYLTGPRHLSAGLAGTIVGGYGLGSAAGTLVGGVLSDRWSPRRTLLVAHFAGAGLLFALGTSGDLRVIAGCAVLVGAAQGMPGPAFVAAIIDVTAEPDRSRAFNLQFWAFNLGMAGAGLIAGVLARLSFLLLFTSDAATTLITALMILWWVPERRGPAPVAAGHAPPVGAAEPARTGFRAALTDGAFMAFVALTLVQGVLTAQNTTVLPLSMTASGIAPSGYGLVMSLSGLFIVIGQLFVPGLVGRWLKGTMLAVSMGLLALGYGGLSVAGSLALCLACAAVWTAGAMVAAPANATIIAELAPAGLRGRYQAVFYLTLSLATSVAPAASGFTWQYLGRGHWLLCAALAVLGCGGHLLASPARERRVMTGRWERRSAGQEPETPHPSGVRVAG